MTTEMRPAAPGRALLRSAAGLTLTALGLGACASAPPPPPPQVGYLAPSGHPPAARSAVIQQAPDLVFGNVVDRLQQSDFSVEHLDEQAGHVVVRYSGNPEPYVDCGWIVSYATGELGRIPAATAAVSFDRRIQREVMTLDRGLQLESRMVINLQPRGSGTVVSPETVYVLTKTIDVTPQEGGAALGQTREIISFHTGEAATFSKGTRCQPNGALERVVLDSLPATTFVAQEPREAVPVPEGEVAVASRTPPPVEPVTLAPALTEPLPGAPTPSEAPPSGPTPAEPRFAEAPPVVPAPAAARGAQPSGAPALAEPRPAAEPVNVVVLEGRVAELVRRLPCATVSASIRDGNSVLLSGYVGREEDVATLRRELGATPGIGAVATALEVQPWPLCEILEVLAPYRDADPQRGLVVTTASRETQLREGDPLSLDIFLPPDAEYLYLGYVQTDGRVGYITIMPVRKWVRETGAIRFESGFDIAGPFGREMIVAVTSARPLFDEALPGYQAPEEYIALLRERLATLAAASGAKLDAAHLVIETQPNPAF
jgi:hypothetical protein